jgi:hypothetical protein
MKKTIVSTNWLNKVIAAAMMMAITTAMPAMAGNKKHNNGKHDKVVVIVHNDKKASHFARADRRTSHFGANRHVYRPDVKACTFKVNRHESHRVAVAKAERIRGVMDTKWNPRTREMTVIYDAKVTSPHYIMHFMA